MLAEARRFVPAETDRFCLSLRREGALLVAPIQEGLAFVDPNPMAAPNLGFQVLGGGPVRPDEVRVASRDLRNHTFDDAPADWFIASGAWELTSRWPCTPGWAWFSGVSREDALIRTKARFTGDQDVQFYAGAKAPPDRGGNEGHYRRAVRQRGSVEGLPLHHRDTLRRHLPGERRQSGREGRRVHPVAGSGSFRLDELRCEEGNYSPSA